MSILTDGQKALYLNLSRMTRDKAKTLWVVAKKVEISGLSGKRNIAIVMSAVTFSLATDIDYFITNVSESIVTPKWIVDTYRLLK